MSNKGLSSKLACLAAILFMLPIVWLSCSNNLEVAGGGVQTTNGEAFYEDGTPTEGALVYVRLESYLADTVAPNSVEDLASLITTTTDSMGHYELDGMDAGNYVIEINDEQGKAALGRFTVEKDDDVVSIDTLILEASAVIMGSIDLPEGTYQVWAQIYGMERLAIADEEGNFEIELPQGEYSVQTVYDSPVLEPAEQVIIVESADTIEVAIAAYDFTREDYADWNLSFEILFNTSDSGANILNDVTDFPMLIRLDSNNFDFTEAHARGDDIRFADSDGSSLPHQTEHWDRENENAQMWVLLPNVSAALHSQTISMYWGNENVPSGSNSRAVFKSSSGYKGVWHMGSRKGVGPDASDNENSAEFFGNLPTTTTGLIGPSQFFDGQTDVMETSNIAAESPVQALTVSAWFKHLSVRNNRIVARHNDALNLGEYGWLLGIDEIGGGIEFSYSSDGNNWNKTFSADSNLAVNAWHHVVAVYDGSGSSVYLSGVVSNPGDTAVTWSAGINMTPHPITLGMTFNRGYAFEGHIDEVRVSGVARSADWIKLSYESQRDSSTLFTFNP